MKWKIIKHKRTKKEIGAIGFIGNKIAVVNTFYSDKDWDNNGKESFLEKLFGSLFGLQGKALSEVLTQALEDPNVFMKDPNGLKQFYGNATTQFATGMVREGIYISYFKMGVRKSAGILASKFVGGTASRFIVRKGMEQAVKEAYDASIQ